MGFDKLIDYHVFEQLGQKILFDVEHMNFYRLDELSFQLLKDAAIDKIITDEMLDNWKKVNGNEIVEQCISDFRKLGLFDPIDCEPKIDHTRRKPQWATLCLDVTHHCNLSCKYCYAPKKENIGVSYQMPISVVERAIELLDESDHWTVRFNGGEPLLNLPVIRQSVEYIKARASKQNKQVKFQLITNGLLLDRAFAEYCRENDIWLTVSFDGDAAVQNTARVTNKGGPSHDVVSENIKNLKDVDISFAINVVLGSHQKNIVDTVQYLQNFGPKAIGIMPADAAPAGWNTVRENPKFIEDQWRSLATAWVEWRKQGPTPVDSIFETEISTILNREKRFFACEAGVSYLAVGPDGIVYPCPTLVGCEEMGLEQEQVGWPELESRDIRSMSDCKQCWARYTCGGGCPGVGYRATGQINQADQAQCRITKSLTELSMAAFSMLPENIRKEIAVKAKREMQKKDVIHG